MTPKISVIIPLYNKGPYIARAIESVLHQTMQNFEIIAVDDHSSDSGPEIVKSFNDSRITLIEQEHKGVSFTRNHGVNLATSDFIAFLDADDEWMPRHLETIIRLIKKYPDAGMYTTAYKIQTPDGQVEWADYTCFPDHPWEGKIPDYFLSISRGDHIINSSQVVIPRKVFYEVGGFPEGYWYGEDIDLFGKIALKYAIVFSWVFGGIYHRNSLNRAGQKNLPPDYQEPFVKTASVALMSGEVPDEIRESLIEYIWKREYDRAYRNVKAGRSENAKTILKQFTTKWTYKEKIKWFFWVNILVKLPSPVYIFTRNLRLKFIEIIRQR
jgi:glycosyltransferase involved in cell wall biosynthesis